MPISGLLLGHTSIHRFETIDMMVEELRVGVVEDEKYILHA